VSETMLSQSLLEHLRLGLHEEMFGTF
jgi:hypothetical protein